VTFPGPSTYPGPATFPVALTVPEPPPTPDPLTVTLDPTSRPPSVQLVVNWPAASTVTILRRDPDGQQWPVSLADPARLDGAGVWVGIDYEPAYGVPISYDMTSDEVPGVIVHVEAGSLVVPREWQSALILPGAPPLSVPVELYEGTLASVARPIVQSKVKVMGRPRLVVLSDTRQAAASQIVIRAETAQERDAVNGILADGQTVKLACDPALGFDVPQTYIAMGDASEDRWIPNLGTDPVRLIKLPFDVVDRPAGGFQAVWNCATVLAQYSTTVQVELDFATCADLVLGRTSADPTAWTGLALMDRYSTCADVLAGFATCADVLTNKAA
jgi:hypothetical protein